MIAALIARDERPLEEAVAGAMGKIQGAFSAVLLAEGKLVGFRDPLGIRPLVLGRLEDDWLLASETCALDLLGAEVERELAPGEMVVVDENGYEAHQAVAPDGAGSLCIFEFIYFARPDSKLRGVELHGARVRMGEQLAAEAPVEADLVMAVPGLGHAGRDRLRARERDPLRRGPDQEPLRRAHVHPARPGAPRARDQDEVQPAR